MIDVRGSREVQAALLALKRAQREIRNDINKVARKQLKPVWEDALRANLTNRLETRVIYKGTRVAVGVRNVSVKAATSTKPLAGGLVPSEQWQSVELGANERPRTFDQRSPKGNWYRRTMIVGRQFNKRGKRGRVAFPAAGEAGKRLVAMWLVAITDGFKNNYFDVKGR